MRLDIERAGYEVRADGVIVGKLGKPMHPSNNGSGYKVVALIVDGKRYNELVHRLVAFKWCPNPNNKDYVNHKDGNKWNNHKDNLEWCTGSENNLHHHRGEIVNLQPIKDEAMRLHILGLSYSQIDKTLSLTKGYARRYITGLR